MKTFMPPGSRTAGKKRYGGLMNRQLPARPNLEHLKNQTKKLLSDWKSGKLEALQRVESYNFVRAEEPALNRAQLIIAREYGFESWPKLKSFVETVASSREEAAK